jgi:tetratricopeptide (TPR) repeat protein
MEQREATPNGTVGLSVGTIQAAKVADGRRDLTKANADSFCAALEEARLARYGGEIKRAQYFYQQALEAAPENIEAETLADILESLHDAEGFLAWDEKALPGLRAAVGQDPNNSERRFSYANLLWRLGREEEAARQYEASLEHPETLCQHCLRDCWNNIGWSLYRREEYAKALPWFEWAAEVRIAGPMGDLRESALPFENMILVYVALHMPGEALAATADYVSRFGRLPWPERHALRKLNIDADALYVQSRGDTA